MNAAVGNSLRGMGVWNVCQLKCFLIAFFSFFSLIPPVPLHISSTN